MSAEFTAGFFVRKPAWHELGVVLDHYPGREEAMKLAGHNWDTIEIESYSKIPNELLAAAGMETNGPNGLLRKDEGWKSHIRSDNLHLLHKSMESYERIPNRIGYDFAELLLDQGFQYETGITLKKGALCALTLLLDEPILIPGDNSELLPYLGLSWAHDGSAALKGNSTTIRRVCANTVAASEAEGERLGTSFSIKHTKNWKAKVEDAKLAMKGVRAQSEAVEALGNELASYYFSEESVAEFIERFVAPPQVLVASMTSKRVQSNVATNKKKVESILNSETIPEAHRNTGWGMYNVATEYLDHVRGTRVVGQNLTDAEKQRTRSEAYVQRTLLSPNKAKEGALHIIRDMAGVKS